jgi:DNA ligase-1
METINFDLPKFQGLKLAADWICDLESSDSRLHKETVIEKALMAAKLGSAGAQCFLYNCYQAYNPFYVFHVRQVPETQGLTHQPNPWPKFWALLESLRTRSVTGGNAKQSILDLSQEFDSDEWNIVCRRVLIKDLRCGISEKTLNKVLGKTEYRIPVFTCQLAQDSTDRPDKMLGHKRLEVKLDGVRVLAVIHGYTVTLMSRNGKEFLNFPQINRFIEDNLDKIGTMCVLDGEIVGESFQTLMRQAHRKTDAKTDDMVYHVFDMIPLSDFQQGHCNLKQHERLAYMERHIGSLGPDGCVRMMPGLEVNLDSSEGRDIMQRFAQDAVAQGFEGIMIKNINAPYECKRSSSWMKWKPTISVDLEVVDFEEGTGRNAGRLGAIVCEGVDNGRRIRVNVGSGMSDLDRDEYWLNRTRLLGHVVEVQADAVTQNQDGSYSLRFPRFLRFRSFQTGEKL